MLKINGVAVAAPLPYKPLIMDLDKDSGRTASGRMVRYRIAVKRKLELEWRNLTKNEAREILNLVSNTSCNVEYEDPQLGVVTKTFYVSDRNTELSPCNGYYKIITFNLTEV